MNFIRILSKLDLSFRMNLIDISIIIPTFQRSNILRKVLKSITDQNYNSKRIEVLIVDSSSKDNTKILVKTFEKKNHQIEYKFLNIKKNNLSAKRNHGAKKANGKYLIFLDDDCIMNKNFINFFYNDFIKSNNKTLLSGQVLYPKEYINQSNYLKLKSQTHFKIPPNTNYNQINLKPDKIVAMCLGVPSNIIKKKNHLFNEKFIGYGFEDYEYACRMSKKYRLGVTRASIIHYEGKPNFEKYLKKYFVLGRSGMNNLLTVNSYLAKKTIYYKIENNFFVRKLVSIPKIHKLFDSIIKVFLIFEKKKILFKLFFNFSRLIAYLNGITHRKYLNYKNYQSSWYD